MEGNKNGWESWCKHVLQELERLNTLTSQCAVEKTELRDRINSDLSQLRREISDAINMHVVPLKIEIGKLQVKSGLWGAVGAGLMLLTYAFASGRIP